MLTSRDIIEALSLLTPEERGEIVKWCNVYGCRDTSRAGNPFVDFAYRELAECMTIATRSPFPHSFEQFSRTNTDQFKKLINGVEAVMRTIEQLTPHRTLIQRMAALRYLTRLCFDYTAHRSLRLSIGTVAEAMMEIEATINQAFPGWLASGDFVTKVLLTTMARGTGDVRDKSFTEAKVR